MTSIGPEPDVILVGGGLANALIALALKRQRPELTLMVIEQGLTLGGNHTWSFHSTDLTPQQLANLSPLIGNRWYRQEVRFPGHVRQLATGYNAITSDALHRHVVATLGTGAFHLGATAAEVTAGAVRLGDGNVVTAPLVIDGRGAAPGDALALGYQKFLGLELELSAPHGQQHPIIMDATVPQHDGYRFVYTLPLTPTRLLIEDTYYSDGADLDTGHLDDRVHGYATARGWSVAHVVRREAGVLPIALAGDIDRHWRSAGDVPRSGMRAWLFHATTGYSLPCAVRLADAIACAPTLTSAAIAPLIERHAREHWQQQRFFRLLNRFMFVGAEPLERVRILERFYTLPQPVIEHFYAGRLTSADVSRLMAVMLMKPPVGLARALQAVPEAAAWRFANKRTGTRAGMR